MTQFPESGSRIDAAVMALMSMSPDTTWAEAGELALAAADAVEAGIAEKLAAALSHLVDVIDGPPFTDASEIEADIVMGEARDALAEFRASAPVENPE